MINTLKSFLKEILPQKVVRLIRNFRYGNYYYFLWLFPIRKDKIVICNYYGKGYGDNGKYIVNKLLEKGTKCEVVWLLLDRIKDESNFPKEVRVVDYGSIRSLYELATAKLWIDNARKEFFPPKRKKQFYIQTWHSPLKLKRVENDAAEYLPQSYIDFAKIDASNCDLMIAGCDFSWNIYRNSFWYSGEILKCGTPRCDVLFKDDSPYKEKVRRNFGILNETKLILFAPTFRSDSNMEMYILEYNQILKAARTRFGGEWRVLVRLHPNVSELSSLIQYTDEILNATAYTDMQELLCASEILITDYSSCMFDMAIAKKKCFIHVRDLEGYLAKERKLYFDLKKLPFYLSKTTEQLISNILNFDEKLYSRNLKKFAEEINLYEKGQASEKLVLKIEEVINNG